jgi:putative hydrolase of the HAD superfamily
MNRVIVWDFDGTLAHRPGLWRGCLTEVLDEHLPGHAIQPDDLLPFLRRGFPWDSPDIAHPELADPDAWWESLHPLLEAAYRGAGLDDEGARRLARLVRPLYTDPSRGWTLFPDTVAVLGELRCQGWRHAILSNHVPELPAIVAGLGLDAFVDLTVTSAAIGYEKPNPAAFDHVLGECGRPELVWMVGDNPLADVAGAEAVGIPAILARTETGGERCARDLHEAAAIIRSSQRPG